MAFLAVEDAEGSFDAVVFSRVYEVARPLLVPDAIVFIKGLVDTAREQPSLIVNEVIPVHEADRAFAAEVRVNLPAARLAGDEGILACLRAALAAHRGALPVTLVVETRSGLRVQIRGPRELYVEAGPDLARAVEAILGPGSIEMRGAQGGGRVDDAEEEEAPHWSWRWRRDPRLSRRERLRVKVAVPRHAEINDYTAKRILRDAPVLTRRRLEQELHGGRAGGRTASGLLELPGRFFEHEGGRVGEVFHGPGERAALRVNAARLQDLPVKPAVGRLQESGRDRTKRGARRDGDFFFSWRERAVRLRLWWRAPSSGKA